MGNVVVVVADVGAVTVVAGVAGVAVVTENPCLTWRKRDTNTVFFRNEIRGGFDSRATGLIALSLSLSLSLSLTHTHTNTHTHTHTNSGGFNPRAMGLSSNAKRVTPIAKTDNTYNWG